MKNTAKKPVQKKSKSKNKFKPLPLDEQTIVITGASSGIGLATARMAAERGAKVVLSSRNERDLTRIVREIKRAGGEAVYIVADVSDFDELEYLRDEAIRHYGQIDTWVNNAGVSMYGPILETPFEEEKQLFETNFWGVRHGCHLAAEAMKDTGGVIINLGSEVSVRSIPVQGIYSASKHAVKAYTDSIRQEAIHDAWPISFCLIRPAGINTPYTEHAVNHLREGEPSLPAPVYDPNVVAEAILACAVSPQRDVYVGAASKVFSMLDTLLPGITDRLTASMLSDDQSVGTSVPHTEDNEGLMHAPHREGEQNGGYEGHVMKSSLYTKMSMHPWATLAVLGSGIAGVLVAKKLSSSSPFKKRTQVASEISDYPDRDLPGLKITPDDSATISGESP